MPKFINLVGQKFHRLIVISRAENNKYNKIKWHCMCICGKKCIVIGSNLKNGFSRSCGCLRKEITKKRRIIHGCYKTSEYRTWRHILSRCKNPNVSSYKNYGGRGIRVCQSWDSSFKAFLEDMGFKPTPRHTIERINNDGNYEPSNCRWLPQPQQAHNRRNNKNIIFNGKALCLTEWSRLLGGKDNLVSDRLKLGWSEEQAVSTPIMKK